MRTLAPIDAPRGPARFRLHLDGGDVFAESVALCAPAPVQSSLLAPLDAPAADELAAIPYAPIAVVHLGFAAGAAAAVPRGFGFLAASSEQLPILGAVFPSMIFPRRAPDGGHLLTCMLGGVRDRDVLTHDDDALVARARDGLRLALGLDAAPVFSRVVRWARAIPQYLVGHLDRLAALEAAEQRLPGLFLGGNALRGVSVADCIKNATPLADRIAAALPT